METPTPIIDQYLEKFPEDNIIVKSLQSQLIQEQEADIFNRKNFYGHIVANALVIHHDQVLTLFHNQLQMHLQPGGHIEETDISIISAAMREAQEETGLSDLRLHNWHTQNKIPILIEPHLIPKNEKKMEEQHYHYDFMYIFQTDTNQILLQESEVSQFKWTFIKDVLDSPNPSFIQKSLQRMMQLCI
jgi:8-oxo-dGTP pyrophosphatase MutT (NUDIX family)